MNCNGSGDPWIATRIAANTEDLGYGGSRVVLKADQEVAVADVHRQVVAARSGETVPMNSPVENAVQRMQGLIKTLKDAFGEEIEHKDQVKRPHLRVGQQD